jgi:hypothetical protein
MMAGQPSRRVNPDHRLAALVLTEQEAASGARGHGQVEATIPDHVGRPTICPHRPPRHGVPPLAFGSTPVEAFVQELAQHPERVRRLAGWAWITEALRQLPTPPSCRTAEPQPRSGDTFVDMMQPVEYGA